MRSLLHHSASSEACPARYRVSRAPARRRSRVAATCVAVTLSTESDGIGAASEKRRVFKSLEWRLEQGAIADLGHPARPCKITVLHPPHPIQFPPPIETPNHLPH